MEIALVAIALGFAGATVVLAVLLWRAREREMQAVARAAETESRASAAVARLDALESVLKDADRLRQDVVNATKAAALETAQALSSKLIDDHKRESAAAKKEAEDRAQGLVKQMGDITTAVAALTGQIQEKGRTLDTVWRALTSPGGAGQMAEIGLANTLKGFGLELGRDYLLQATTAADEVTGQRLRPDALVFLPGNSALVIDCKASKFLLEIAEAAGGEGEAGAYANLARTMNQHLKGLADKNYRGAVLAAWRDAGRGGDVGHVVSIMYLPNEAALEKLDRADPSFFAKAREAQIIPAGPAGLYCALTLAAAEITKERQVENQQRILEAAQALLDGVRIALGYASDVNKGIRAAAEGYDKFTKSVNQRLLPRARRLVSLGVKPDKALPAGLPALAVLSQESDQLIEGEASELADEPILPRLLAE